MKQKKNVLIVYGTRPEAIKMAPVYLELKKSNNIFNTITCVTAQHRQMLDQVNEIFDLKPDIDLNLMKKNQSLSKLTSKAMSLLTDTIKKTKPEIILVQGDTTTAMVSALAGFYEKIPVGHVEAGLRTKNIYSPFPEEMNRRIISELASYHFAPTEIAYKSLIKEGITKDNVYKTGNTVIDALLIASKKVKKPKNKYIPIIDKYILFTAHRRENFGEGIINICKAIKRLEKELCNYEIIYPVHLNPNILNPVKKHLAGIDRVHLIPPTDYHDFIYLMKNAHIIVTDSGGIQEEAPSLGKPVFVLRNNTERPEAIKAKVAKLVGTEPDKIVNSISKIIKNRNEYKKMAKKTNPFGDGKASERIVNILKEI